MNASSSHESSLVRHHLSSNHLFSAYVFGRSARQIEDANQLTDNLRLEHRSLVIASILCSVAFAEAAINELYAICAEDPMDVHVSGHPEDQRFGSIGPDTVRILGSLWRIENFQRSAGLLDKYQTSLRVANRQEFDKGSNPYQDAKLVIDLRNLLVHFKPEQREIAVGAGNKLAADAMYSKYRGKFDENPLGAKYSLFGTPDGPLVADYPFFPEKCLGSDCAKWGFRSMLALADEVFRRLNTTWYYHWLFDGGAIPSSTG
jgi:hypothetical protein